MKQKRVVILGSTGSIGKNTLKVIEKFPGRFQVVGLTAYNNLGLLEEQARKFSPKCVAVYQKQSVHFQNRIFPKKIKILSVEDDLGELVSKDYVDIVVIAMRGSAALEPFLSAVRSGKIVAPANKEALVVAGDLIMAEAKRFKAKIVPIDSEQSAIFQCLEGNERSELKRIILTASGGALWNVPKSKFDQLSVNRILAHPKWKMGRKITVDSATMMNKGFEIIEALRLFQLRADQIDVVIHPQAIIHSMVEFIDGSILAQLGKTDMRLPIQYALTYPQRWDSSNGGLNFTQLRQLTFEKPNYQKFSSLALAMTVAEKGGTLPAVLNAADEVAVDAFLEEKISFSKIYKTVEKVVQKHTIVKKPTLSSILEADRWARDEANSILN